MVRGIQLQYRRTLAQSQTCEVYPEIAGRISKFQIVFASAYIADTPPLGRRDIGLTHYLITIGDAYSAHYARQAAQCLGILKIGRDMLDKEIGSCEAVGTTEAYWLRPQPASIC